MPPTVPPSGSKKTPPPTPPTSRKSPSTPTARPAQSSASTTPGDTLSLYTTVPGGQQVHVAADGQLHFTQAHSAYTGNGSFVEGFGIAQGHVLFENTGFVAVATNETSNISDNRGIAYKIYAASRTNLTGEGFDNTTVPAWQYK